MTGLVADGRLPLDQQRGAAASCPASRVTVGARPGRFVLAWTGCRWPLTHGHGHAIDWL